MNTKNEIKNIISADLPQLENEICHNLRRFFKFSSHTLYFPNQPELTFLEEEKRLILPLTWNGQNLAALLLEDIDENEIKDILPRLAGIMDICLKMASLKASLKLDKRTGLANEETFYETLENLINAHLENDNYSEYNLHHFCISLLILNMVYTPNFADPQIAEASIVARSEYKHCEKAFLQAARLLEEIAPDNAIMASLGRYEGRYEFGIILPEANGGHCRELAANFLKRIGETPGNSFAAGYACFPQDLTPQELHLPLLPQVLRLRDCSRIAAHYAKNKLQNNFLNNPADGSYIFNINNFNNMNSRDAAAKYIIGYSSILHYEGRIIENSSHGRIHINLGAKTRAQKGMRFQVISPLTNQIKGHIKIIETSAISSLAEILYIADPSDPPAPGDYLRLIRKDQLIFDTMANNPINDNFDSGNSDSALLAHDSSEKDSGRNEQTRPNTTWLNHSDFFKTFNEIADSHFILAIGSAELNEDSKMHLFLDELENSIKENPMSSPQLLGRYSQKSYIFYQSLNTPLTITNSTKSGYNQFYESIAWTAQKYNIKLAIGIFEYPFLNYSKTESETCALKALEYARLLPFPHVGVLDSLALNISADKRSSQGDIFGAMQEYELAVLADKTNADAWNSLGVTAASMHKDEAALRYFTEALANAEDLNLKSKICYNLGILHQKNKDFDKARNFFNACLAEGQNHVYAWLRLGQIYEIENEFSEAKTAWQQALKFAEADHKAANAALKYLAQMEENMAQFDAAKSCLYDALMRNPGDVQALLSLAKLYLEEDPALSELLTRRSLSFGAGEEGWLILGQALKKQEKWDEYNEIMSR